MLASLQGHGYESPSSTSDILLIVNLQFGGLFLPTRGYSDAFFFGSISLIALTLAYVIVLCPESRSPSTSEVGSHTQDNLSFKTSPLLSARRLIFNFASALLLPISMFAPRTIPNSSRKNYNMAFVGLSLFLYIVSTVCCQKVPFYFSQTHDVLLGRLLRKIPLCSTCLYMDDRSGMC